MQELAGQQAVLADEAVDLGSQRHERRQVDEGQEQEHEARQAELRRAHEVADQQVQQAREEGTVRRHLAVAPLRERSEAGQPAVEGERERLAPVVESAEDGLGAPARPTFGLHEVDGLAEGLHRDLGEAEVGRLVRFELDGLADPEAQVLHTAAAEAAVAVPDQAGAIQ